MSKWHPHTLGQLLYAVERLDGVLLDEALGGSLDHDDGLCGLLDTLLLLAIAALLPSLHSGQALNVALFAQTALANLVTFLTSLPDSTF